MRPCIAVSQPSSPMDRLALFLLLAALLVPTVAHTAAAQDSTEATASDPVRAKDPGVATAYSVVFLGGGHLYAEEYTKAGLLWAFGPGTFGVGLHFYQQSNGEGVSMLYGGIATLAIMWIYSITNAADAARRWNASRQSAISIWPAKSNSGAGVRLSVQF